jgi:hypothetical protein
VWKTVWFWFLVVVVLIAVASLAGDPDTESATQPTNGSPPADPTEGQNDPSPSPSPSPTTCAGTPLDPSMTQAQVEAALDAGAAGATFCFAPGTYRMALTPKNGQTLIGEDAILKGTRVATGWTLNGSGIWVLAGATFDPVVKSPPFEGSERSCEAIPANCHYADLFKDGVRLTRVLGDTTPPPDSWDWDYATDRVYANTSDPNQELMELTNQNVGITTGGNNLIEGFSVMHFATRGVNTAAGDVLRDIEFAWNHGEGFRLGGNPAAIYGGHTHHNGQLGGFCAGANKTIDGLEFSFNNNLHFANSAGGYWGAGAIKCVQTTGLVVRRIYSHDNFSDGFWLDANSRGTLLEDSVIVRNERFGIFHEISCAVEVRGNILQDNANDGMFIHSSIDADVHDNTFGGNGDAAVEIRDNLTRQAECAASPGAYGNPVYDNILNGDAVKGCISPRNDCSAG